MNSELLEKILEDDIISVSGGKSDVDLLGPDFGLDIEEDLSTTKPYSIIDQLMDGPTTHHSKYRHSTNTITSTIFSTVSHPLSIVTITKTHSTINTTSPIPLTSHNDTPQTTAPAHIQITTTTNKSPTTHILKTLRKHTTVYIPPTSASPQLGTPPKNISSTNHSKSTIHNRVKSQNYTFQTYNFTI